LISTQPPHPASLRSATLSRKQERESKPAPDRR
jgi:hypothetical protein